MKRLTSMALMACLVGCATPHTERLDSITITQRPTYAICAGYCPNVDVIVREDGRVTVSSHHLDEPDEVRHLKVTLGKAARFIRIMSPHRPPLREAGPVGCGFCNTTDPLVLKAYPHQVTWTDADGGTFQLHSCGDPSDPNLSETIRRALWSIDLYKGGEPR